MVSYKKLYEDLKEEIKRQNREQKTDYLCPLCDNVILNSLDEYYCSNENCKFDKTGNELFYYYAESIDLEMID